MTQIEKPRRFQSVRKALLGAGGCGAVLICSAAWAAAPDATLLGLAHGAVMQLVKDRTSASFDDQFVQVFPKEGLVCAGKISSVDRSGNEARSEPYYFSRTQGAALEDERTPVWGALANACVAALERRVDKIDVELGNKVPATTELATQFIGQAPRTGASPAWRQNR